MSHHTPAEIDPHELERAQEFWRNFTQTLKYSIIGIAILLAILAIAFTDI